MSVPGRFCCKSLFALAIKISFGCTGDFHVNMWGTSSSEEKLAGDPGNVIEATSIGGRRSDFFYGRKINAGQFRTFATVSAIIRREQPQQAAQLFDDLVGAGTVAGTSSPSALAVLRLITNSYFTGACTGRSAGFSPLRMRST